MKFNEYKQSDYIGWCADNKDGTYTNPILYVDYSDPDVVRVGNEYFMVASSFCNAPGLPLLYSVDLVNWKLINYCIKSVPGSQFDRPLHGCGVWAPAIRYYNGEYIVFFPMPDEGIYVVKTKDPWGKWEKPYCLVSTKGWIDPCPFWDEDGKAYMVNAFAKSRIGFKSVLQIVEMSPDCTKIIGEPKYVFDGNIEDEETIEGPKLYKKDDYYYIFAPAGGVKQGWQTVLRSKNIYGPYEKRRVLMQLDTEINGPHQGAWVDTVTGEDWFIHFQDVYAAGRIVHLEPMSWKDNWPVIGIESETEYVGKPVHTFRKPNVDIFDFDKYDSDVIYDHVNNDDEFAGTKLNLRWQWNANVKRDLYRLDNNSLYLSAVKKEADSISDLPNLLLQKWALPEFTAKTQISLEGMKTGDYCGLISLGVDYGAIAIRKTPTCFEVLNIKGHQNFENERAHAKDEIEVIDNIDLSSKNMYFVNQVEQLSSTEKNTDGPFEFDIPKANITLMYSLDDAHYHRLNPYMALAGRWVGVKHGVFSFNEQCDGGEARFLYYKFVSKIV